MFAGEEGGEFIGDGVGAFFERGEFVILTEVFDGVAGGVVEGAGDLAAVAEVLEAGLDAFDGVVGIEVADVDEFTVARVHRGQRAVVAVPALEVQGVSAIVRSVGAQPVGASVPDPSFTSTTDHYPVTVDLMESVPGLHIGMAVRLRLDE